MTIAYQYKYFRKMNAVRVTIRDRLDREDLNGIYEEMYRSSLAPSHSRSLVDLGDVTACDIGFREVHWHCVRSTELLRCRNWTLAIAIHAPTAVTYGIARMYQQLFENAPKVTVAVTETRPSALESLGLPNGFPGETPGPSGT